MLDPKSLQITQARQLPQFNHKVIDSFTWALISFMELESLCYDNRLWLEMLDQIFFKRLKLTIRQ